MRNYLQLLSYCPFWSRPTVISLSSGLSTAWRGTTPRLVSRACLSACLSVCLSVCRLSVYLSFSPFLLVVLYRLSVVWPCRNFPLTVAQAWWLRNGRRTELIFFSTLHVTRDVSWARVSSSFERQLWTGRTRLAIFKEKNIKNRVSCVNVSFILTFYSGI